MSPQQPLHTGYRRRPAEYRKELRHLGDHLRGKRLDLSLTKKVLAALLGAGHTPHTAAST